MALPGALVDGDWLAAALRTTGADTPAVADVRWYLDGRSGRTAWAEGHIPGAVWVDIDTVLSAPPGPGTGRHPLPARAAMEEALAGLGLTADRPVVAYDDAGGSIAARLWWMLHTLGWDVAVLDGGLAGWAGPLEAGNGSTTGAAPPAPTAVEPVRPGDGRHAGQPQAGWPEAATIDTAGLAAEVVPARGGPVAADRGAPVVLDARSGERYRGEPHPADPRPGHIPGARSAPWAGNLDPATGRWLPADALRRRYEALGVRDGTRVVASCGSGVTACHTLLALHLAGLDSAARLYPGSWSAWAADPALPIDVGSEGI